MIRCNFRYFCNIIRTNSRTIFRKVTSPSSSRNSFIVIPEIPNNLNNINVDNILSISSYDCFIEFSRCRQAFETELTELFEKLLSYKDGNLDYENTIVEIEKIIRALDIKFKYLKLTYHFKEDPGFEVIFLNLFKKVLVANQEILNMPKMISILNILHKSNLSILQKDNLDKILRSLKIYGIGLPNEQMNKLHKSIDMLVKSQNEFSKSVHLSLRNIEQCINKTDMSIDTPQWLLRRLNFSRSENLLKINLKDKYSTLQFLKFCENHQVRNQIWLTGRQIGGKILFDKKLSNSSVIMEIRKRRKEIANILGEKTYCDLIFNSKKRMAKSLDDVVHLLQISKTSISMNAEYEYKHVKEYSEKEKGLKENLVMYDYNYLYNCYALQIMKCPWAKMETENVTFDIQKLLDRIFFIIQKWFNISFTKELSNSDKIVYSVFNNKNVGKIIFVINKNSLKNLINVTSIHGNNEEAISFVMINLPLEKPTLLNSLEILRNIGKILEGLHNTVNFEISPLYSGQAPDAIDICSQFILHSFIASKKVFKYVFSELDPLLAENLSSSYLSKNSLVFNDVTLIEKLYIAYFDIEMWLSDKYWHDVQIDLWDNFFSRQSKIYFTFEKFDEWPCGATEIFANNLWGGVHKYSIFWTNHVVKLLSDPFILANLREWDPNEIINPELSKLFEQFKSCFIENPLSCKSDILKKLLP